MVAGCQTIVPRGEQPTGPATTEQPADRPVEPGLPTDTQRHRVALLVPMSGANAGVGQSIANATTLALLDTKTEKVRITTYDTNLGAAAAVSRALSEGNRLILGPLMAEDARVVGPIAQKAGVPVISFSNDSSIAGNGVYSMGYAPAQSIERVVTFARSKGLNSFAALVPRGTYGERAGTSLLRAVEGAGGTVVSMQPFDRSPGSITAAVRKLDASSPYDAVLIADGGRVAIQAAPILRKSVRGSKAQVLGTELWNTESTIVGTPALRGAWFASVSDGLYRQLATRYRTRFGSTPFRLSSLGYDAVLLTVRIARDWQVGTPFPARRLADSGGFSGIDGAFRFTRNGIAERALEINQVNAGSFAVLDAAPGGFQE
ncbi:MAG: penicillin-binding protein activator [Sphingobium sp.]|nr:penicillin-binding protein activator [Sphingobium sp.]MDX3910298.1 penicillin-binding protein activator [Sphingobium sp.]